MAKKKEMVNHPQHYGGDTTYEVIKVIEAWGLDNSFCLGNAIKYIARAHRKANQLEDLHKAAWYLDREIKKLEAKNEASVKNLARKLPARNLRRRGRSAS